jgi:hypothetical protein
MEWLVADFRCFGMRYQNWMPLIAGIVLLYIGYLMLRRDHGRSRRS